MIFGAFRGKSQANLANKLVDNLIARLACDRTSAPKIPAISSGEAGALL
ncbi:hypothetical protein [Vagococcus silagei]